MKSRRVHSQGQHLKRLPWCDRKKSGQQGNCKEEAMDCNDGDEWSREET